MENKIEQFSRDLQICSPELFPCGLYLNQLHLHSRCLCPDPSLLSSGVCDYIFSLFPVPRIKAEAPISTMTPFPSVEGGRRWYMLTPHKGHSHFGPATQEMLFPPTACGFLSVMESLWPQTHQQLISGEKVINLLGRDD